MRKKKKNNSLKKETANLYCTGQTGQNATQVPTGPLLGSGWYFPAYCGCTINAHRLGRQNALPAHIPTAADPAESLTSYTFSSSIPIMGRREGNKLISVYAQHIVSTPKKGHFSDHVIIWMCVGPLFERTPAFSQIQSSYQGKKMENFISSSQHKVKDTLFFFWFKKQPTWGLGHGVGWQFFSNINTLKTRDYNDTVKCCNDINHVDLAKITVLSQPLSYTSQLILSSKSSSMALLGKMVSQKVWLIQSIPSRSIFILF